MFDISLTVKHTAVLLDPDEIVGDAAQADSQHSGQSLNQSYVTLRGLKIAAW